MPLRHAVGAGAAQDKDESTLAKAYFRWSAEGWNATTKDGDDWPSSGELGYLKSSDDDDTLWYYTASADFLGELAVPSGGRAVFRRGVCAAVPPVP